MRRDLYASDGEDDSLSRKKIMITVGAVIAAIIALTGSISAYLQGKPVAYDLPQDWGMVRFLVPPGGALCAIDSVLQYESGQPELLAVIAISGLHRSGARPVIGVEFNGGASPPGYVWPLPDQEAATIGDIPDPNWFQISEFFGTYLGHFWLVRLPEQNKAFSLETTQPAEHVADGLSLKLGLRASNENGVDKFALTIRPSAAFRTQNAGRTSYRPPQLRTPAVVPELINPTTLRDVPNSEPANDGKSPCLSEATSRKLTIIDENVADQEGRLNPLQRLDVGAPKPSPEDALQWTAKGREKLSPAASGASRNVGRVMGPGADG